jgi:hypothetical protein
MRASVIFSTNDTLATLGVIAAGLLVAGAAAHSRSLDRHRHQPQRSTAGTPAALAKDSLALPYLLHGQAGLGGRHGGEG